MSQAKRVTLDDLSVRSEVVLPSSGRTVAVKPYTARDVPLLKEWAGRETPELWELAARALPDATPEEIEALTPAQALAVVGLGRELIEQVEQFVTLRAPKGNGEAPPV